MKMTGKPQSISGEDQSQVSLRVPDYPSREELLSSTGTPKQESQVYTIIPPGEASDGAREFLLQVSNVTYHIVQVEKEIEALREMIKVRQAQLNTLREIERGMGE